MKSERKPVRPSGSAWRDERDAVPTRRKKEQSAGPLVFAFWGGAAALLLGVVIVAVVLIKGSGGGDTTTVAESDTPTTPTTRTGPTTPRPTTPAPPTTQPTNPNTGTKPPPQAQPQPQPQPPSQQAVTFTVKDPEEGRVYLGTLKDARHSPPAPAWQTPGFGLLGDGRKILVNGGWHAQKGLSLGCPSVNGKPMFIEYDVPADLGPCLLQMAIGLDDTSTTKEKPFGTVFKVEADGAEVWMSRPIKKAGEFDECRVALKGCKKLTLSWHCPDTNPNQRFLVPVWIDPYLISASRASK